LSFSSTGVSPEDVIEGYAGALQGPKLIESSANGKIRTLVHSDGRILTAVRAMKRGPDSHETIVQKMHSTKLRNEISPASAAELAEFAPLLASIRNADGTERERNELAARVLKDAAMLKAAEHETQARLRAPRRDKAGFDVPGVPRYPGSVRVSSMAMEDGKIQIVRYATDASADMITSYYKHALEPEGWAPDSVSELAREQNAGAEQQHLLYTHRSGASLNLLVTPSRRSGTSSVTVMVQ
jgi:hypothetical protein